MDPLSFAIALFVLGLLIGSFLNVVVHRLPIMMEREWRSDCASLLEAEAPEDTDSERFDLIVPRSRCPKCNHAIAAWDNVPVLSYMFLRGKCRGCKTKISVRYPLVELVSGVFAGLSAWHFGSVDGAVSSSTILHAIAVAVFSWYLVALALIDLDTQLLPDSLTMPLLWFGIALGLSDFHPLALEDAVLGAMFGYLSLWSVYWAFKLVTGKEGMGYGDFKLLAALGAWLGWQALPALILVSSVVGAVIGITMVASAFIKRSEPIPFGPYLALAGIIVMFWGEKLSGLFGQGAI